MNEYRVSSIAYLFAAEVLDGVLQKAPEIFDAQFHELPLADMDKIRFAVTLVARDLRELGEAHSTLAAFSARLAQGGGL